MKLNRLLTVSVLGFSLLTTSAFADSRNNDSSNQSHWSFLSWIYNPVADSRRECDQYGQNSGKGNNCDRGRGNGGGYCGTGGSTGGSTGSSTGGSTGWGGSTGGSGTTGPKG
jgi:hypothetical protein